MEVDSSIRLVPVDAPTSRPNPRRRFVPFLLIGAAILLSLSVVLVLVVKVMSVSRGLNIDVSVAAQRDSATERAEAISVFSTFDAADARRGERSFEDKFERESIGAFFHRLQDFAAANDDPGFRKLVDFDRLLKRIEFTGDIRGWSSLDRRFLRTELKTSVGMEHSWVKLLVAGVVAPQDDADSRIVYAYGWDQAGNDQSENRFWIVRNGDSWKLYDWERLDLGLSESQKWGAYCKHAQSPAMHGFQRWAELVGEADEQSAQSRYEVAKEKLRLAELEPVPAELEDYRWLLTGYRWASLSEVAETERCFANIKQPDESPGAYFSLMNCKRWSDPVEALQYAERYEAVTGPSPELLKAKAALLERLNRKKEAIDQWRKILRIEPDNVQALAEFYLALPDDDKSAFAQHLARLDDPVVMAASIADTVGYRDYKALVSLAEFLQHSAPGKSETHYVSGYARRLNGDHDAAAEYFRQAYAAANDKEAHDRYANSYIEAMIPGGRVIEAVESLPDSSAVFESLFVQFDEDEISLTKDEYGRLAELCAARHPDNLDAIYRRASLAIEEKRYTDAERILRSILASTPAEESRSDREDEAENHQAAAYRSSFDCLLATALWKSGRLREAYEGGDDPQERFVYLARCMIQEKRWADARQLVAMRDSSGVNDPETHNLQAELAAHEGQWDDAIQHLEQARQSASADEGLRFDYRLSELYVNSGKWMEYYSSHEDPKNAFEILADHLVSHQDWHALSSLVAAHRVRFSDDPRIARFEADAAWDRGNDEAYLRSTAELLESQDENAIASYERVSIERRRLTALLRSNRMDEALKVALESQRKENDVTWLAIVKAATGNLPDAKRLAREAAEANETARSLYSDDEVARVFLGEQFAELQEEFPVELPYQASSVGAVFLMEDDWQLEADDIAAALRELDIDTLATAEPLQSIATNVNRGYALRLDGGSVWLVVGNGNFHPDWTVDVDRGVIAHRVNNSNVWLAVGSTAWTESSRKKVEALARRLVVKLAEGRNAVVCVPSRNYWEGYLAHEVTPELLVGWQSSGNLRFFERDGVSLESTNWQKDVAGERQFASSLRDAVRAYEASPRRRFEVWACVSRSPAVDPLRLRVKTVRRAYGGLEFDGELDNQPMLISALRPGLSMRLQEHEIQAFRLDDADPVYGP